MKARSSGLAWASARADGIVSDTLPEATLIRLGPAFGNVTRGAKCGSYDTCPGLPMSR